MKEMNKSKTNKYRKKPVVIEAIQYTVRNVYDILDFVGDKLAMETDSDATGCVSVKIAIKTLEGDMIVSPGDYVIKGISNEFYPCKPDIFEKTYEKE